MPKDLNRHFQWRHKQKFKHHSLVQRDGFAGDGFHQYQNLRQPPTTHAGRLLEEMTECKEGSLQGFSSIPRFSSRELEARSGNRSDVSSDTKCYGEAS